MTKYCVLSSLLFMLLLGQPFYIYADDLPLRYPPPSMLGYSNEVNAQPPTQNSDIKDQKLAVYADSMKDSEDYSENKDNNYRNLIITIKLFQKSISDITNEPNSFFLLNREKKGISTPKTKLLQQYGKSIEENKLAVVFLGMAAVAPISSMYNSRSNFEKAVIAYLDQDYVEALKIFKKTEKKEKEPNSQFALGFMHDQGLGTKVDSNKAAKQYLKAAEQGLSEAQYNLALLYVMGRGVPKDDKEAANWFHEAAEQGDAEAQTNLGIMYATGHGVNQDYDGAIKWLRKAADQGDDLAAINLGYIYFIKAHLLQENISQNFTEAKHWFEQAANSPELIEKEIYKIINQQKHNKIIVQKVKEALAQTGDRENIMDHYHKLISSRGTTVTPLAIEMKNQNQLITEGSYIICLPNEKKISYPVVGKIHSDIKLREGESIEIMLEKKSQHSRENFSLDFNIETNFLISEITFEGAKLPIELLIPDFNNPEKIITLTSVTINEKELAGDFTLSIISHEGREHIRNLTLSDKQLEVISPADVMFD